MKKIAFLLFSVFLCCAYAQKDTFTDPRDKKKYKTVKLGGRVWMAEDLNYKKNKLYNFENVKNACPAGWRLPSKSAWEDLKKEISETDAKQKAKIGWNTQGKWWAATSNGPDATVYYVVVNSGFKSIDKLDKVESANLSVRCIQNTKAKPSEKKNDIKLYKTIKIGSQLWMAENLNYKTGKSWCIEDDDYYCNMYGRLYDWNTAAKACPAGWHLPTRREWNETSAAEFSETAGNWWGITEHNSNDAYSRHIKAGEKELNEKITNKSISYSVRCVQNIPKAIKTNNIKQYKTVKIGNQTWMAENLNYKTGKSWCFENDDFYCKKYGALYDWNTATKACPSGWHLPSDMEWNELESSAGKDVAGAISALKGGWRDSDTDEKTGHWQELGENGTWWTSTLFEATGSAQVRHLSSAETFSSTLKNKSSGLSIRCLQNPQVKKISKIFTDARDNKKYNVIIIGNMLWMKDNLNYNAKGSFCYDNKPENCNKYGRLYDWDLAQTVCPAPWRLASHEDWMNLTENSGGNVAGKKLKSKQQWNGTDNYGFSALPGGFTKAQGFAETGERGYWWTSDDYGPNGRYSFMASGRDSVTHSGMAKSAGYSVRCVMDCGPFNCVVE